MTIQHNDFLEECAIFNVATGGGGGGGGPVSSVNGIGPDGLGNVYLTSDSIPQGTQNIFLTNDGGTTDNLATMPTITSLQSQINGKLSLSGGTMTGNLILNTDPSLSLQAATKQYVDNSISAAPYVLRSGDTMTGPLILNADPALPLQAATKEYVDNSILSAPYVLRAGDTMTGNLAINANLSVGTSTVNAPLTIQNSGGTTYATALNAYFGSVVGATAGNFYQITVAKGNFEAVLLGINKDTTTGNIPANYAYLSTFSSFGGIALGNGNNAGLPNNASLLMNGNGQVNIPNSLSIGSQSISSNALLQLNSTTQGMMPVVMTTAQMNAIPVTPLDAGLMVYVTDLIDGYYYFDGTQWVYIANDSGAGSTLQSAYDAGNTIALTTGLPFYVSNQSGISNFVWLYSPGAPTPYNYSSLEGVQFTPNVNVSVTALQYVNQYFPSGSRQVAIFRTSDQSLIVSDLVYKTDPLDSTGNYRTHAINPVTLYAGVSYLVVCIVPANENWTFYSLSNPPNFNYTAVTYGQNASTIVYPSTITAAPTAIYGNQNFQYSTVVSSVSINDGTQHALLNAYSTTQGFMPPVLNSTQEATLTALLGSLDKGLQWFNSTNNINSYWDGLNKQDVLAIGNIIQGSNMFITDNGNGTVTFSSTGGGSTTTQVQGSFNSSSPLTSTPVTAADTPIAVNGSTFNVVNAVGTNVSLATISGVQTAIIQNTSAGSRWCTVNYDLTLFIPTNSNQTYGFTVYTNTGAIIFFKEFTVTGTAPLYRDFTIATPMVLLNTNDYVYLTVNSSLNTGPAFNAYYFNGRLLDTTVASLPSTNSLAQGSNNLYLSQNGGTTYGYLSGTAVVGNLPAFNSAGGQLIDSGVPAASLFTWQIVTGTTQQMAINTGYIVKSTSPVTFTLPLTSAGIGAMEIVGTGTATWQVNTNAGQIIEYNGLTGSSYAQSNTANDSARIVYAGDGSGEFNIELSNGMALTLS